jgi:hypothetical protein
MAERGLSRPHSSWMTMMMKVLKSVKEERKVLLTVK